MVGERLSVAVLNGTDLISRSKWPLNWNIPHQKSNYAEISRNTAHLKIEDHTDPGINNINCTSSILFKLSDFFINSSTDPGCCSV